MYSESWPPKYATNVGQYRGNDHFLLEYSFAYSNSTNPGSAQPLPAVYQAKRDILYPANSALAYCSSILGYTTPTVTATVSVTSTTIVATTTVVARRDVIAEPSALSKYPASIVTSACSLAATPVTQTITTTATTTAATVSATATTTQSFVPAPTAEINFTSNTGSYHWWAVGDTPCSSDSQANCIEGYSGDSEGDQLHIDENGVVTVVATANANDVGSTIYYDAVGQTFGPGGFAGVASAIAVVAPGDSASSNYQKAKCFVDTSSEFKCYWANTGVPGDWWFCNGVITLAKSGTDLSSQCGGQANPYDGPLSPLLWQAPGTS
jgi:hypothetical protein